MLKKILLATLVSIALIAPTLADENFSQMNPTVKITSYKKLFTNQVVAYGSGSGTVVTKDGIVITNNHVIFDEDEQKALDAFEICITFEISEEPVCKYTGRLIARDKDMDIALLKINNEDVFGKRLPDLKLLNYKNPAAPKEQTRIQVIGYPGSGGETITITQGQISGFEEFNDYQYFKTDTDFDHGSSGGTALDEDGNYIGIPTYIRSYAENVGFFLDLREAQDWINGHIGLKPEADFTAESLLEKELARFSKANEELAYVQDDYPFIQVALPEGWEFLDISNDSLFAYQKNLSEPAQVGVFISKYQFKVDEAYMDKLNEELEQVKEMFPDYLREDVTFAGEDAWKISYTSMSNKNVTYYIPYGYAIIGISYSLDLNEVEKQEAAIQPVLNSFKFTQSPEDDSQLPETLSFKEPAFEITRSGDWRLQKNESKSPMSLLLEGVQNGNFEGSFSIYYDQVPKDERHLSAEDRLDEITKYMGSRKLVYKNAEVTLGGLKGFLYTYEFEGQDYQEIRKHMSMSVRDGDYEFTIEYDDLTEDFDKNLPVIRKMLDSFIFKGETETSDSFTSYGNLGNTFSDIQFHTYASAISNLADKGIVSGYSDGTFRPESLVSRAEALKMILTSKNQMEEEKGLGGDVDFDTYYFRTPYLNNYRDIRSSDWYANYANYAIQNKILEGLNSSTFAPHQNITLSQAMKIILNVYEIPVWDGVSSPWYKKFMDKGFELRLIPYGMYEANRPLTRGELSNLVNTVYNQAKN